MTLPILIFSDTPSAPTGLARITRDLATRLSAMPDVKVATVGYGACSSSRLPFHQYSWAFNGEWIIHDLPELWADFTGSMTAPGIILSIQDATRMPWFAVPESCSDSRVKAFLQRAPIKKWGYFPMDAEGPFGRLPWTQQKVLLGYDRILAYSKWAENLVARTIGIPEATKRDLQSLPHGIDTDVFYERDRKLARDYFGKWAVGRDIPIMDDELLIGIVATNQARKDFGLGIAAFAEIVRRRKGRLWIHTDTLERNWDIPGLLGAYGVEYAMVSTAQHSDETMAHLYSACDATLAIGLGEGFGYPIFESLACGTPVVHGNYGGAPEHMPRRMLVQPNAWRLEGFSACRRPVYDPREWSRTVLELKRKDTQLPDRLKWENLWAEWESWFLKGLECDLPSQSSLMKTAT